MTTGPAQLGWLDPMGWLRESSDMAAKLLHGAGLLIRMGPEDVAVEATPKDEVHRVGSARLYRYRAEPGRKASRPLLIVYALFNRYYMLDLQPDRSLVRHLLDEGLDVHLVDWGYPDRGDRWLTLDDYVNGFLDEFVDVVRARTGSAAVDVLGVCQGGCMALCYASLHPEKVRSLVTMVTPVDFHAGSTIVSDWIGYADIDAAVDALGLIPGELISLGFSLRSPFDRNVRKYLDMMDLLEDQRRFANFLRMERWIYDTPDLPGEVFRQWIRDFYQRNALVRGELWLGDRRVSLRDITMPVLNVYAEKDDLIAPESAMALGDHVGTDAYTARSLPVGHIGMYVSGRAQRQLPPILAEWLREQAGEP